MEEVRILQEHTDTCPKGEDSNLIFTACSSCRLPYKFMKGATGCLPAGGLFEKWPPTREWGLAPETTVNLNS